MQVDDADISEVRRSCDERIEKDGRRRRSTVEVDLAPGIDRGGPPPGHSRCASCPVLQMLTFVEGQSVRPRTCRDRRGDRRTKTRRGPCAPQMTLPDGPVKPGRWTSTEGPSRSPCDASAARRPRRLRISGRRDRKGARDVERTIERANGSEPDDQQSCRRHRGRRDLWGCRAVAGYEITGTAGHGRRRSACRRVISPDRPGQASRIHLVVVGLASTHGPRPS